MARPGGERERKQLVLSPCCNMTDRPRNAEWLFVFNQIKLSQMRPELAGVAAFVYIKE